MSTQAHTLGNDADRLIAEYRQAYQLANEAPAPDIRYSRGWFTIRYSRGGSYGTKYRAHAIAAMRDTLLSRARAEGRA